jgi:hypothetical protein
MVDSQPPESWVAPRWHADYGDVLGEFEHLRQFALLLLRLVPTARVGLDLPEVGLMEVLILLPDGTAAEVHSVPTLNNPALRRFAVFLSPGTADEEEIYSDTLDAAVRLFT